jgi:hypothetical protein
MTTDGKGIVMRREHLRAATKKAAEARTSKMAKRLSRGEKRNCKRMAQVAAVYTIAAFVRRPEDIVRDLAPVRVVGDAPTRPRPEHKRVWASVEKEPAEVIAHMFDEAERRDPDRAKVSVVLVDGGPTQLALVKKEARRRGVAPTIVLDLMHVLEYVWKASFAFNGEGNAKAESWVSERLLGLLRGKASTVAAAMRRSATLRNMQAKDREAVDDCADYLLKYRKHLRYDEYLAAGLPISTGVIEGACRHLVKDRMDLTGACWSVPGAEAVLKLRALRASGDFEDYWAFHESAEYTRNHARLFQGTPPATVMPSLKPSNRRALRIVN